MATITYFINFKDKFIRINAFLNTHTMIMNITIFEIKRRV